MLVKICAIAFGGALGSLARYFLSVFLSEKLGTNFPYGTLLVNWLACLFLGLFVALCLKYSTVPSPLKLFIITGVLGGFSTFSTFSLETIELLQSNLLTGTVYIAVSIIGGLSLIMLGLHLI